MLDKTISTKYFLKRRTIIQIYFLIQRLKKSKIYFSYILINPNKIFVPTYTTDSAIDHRKTRRATSPAANVRLTNTIHHDHQHRNTLMSVASKRNKRTSVTGIILIMIHSPRIFALDLFLWLT